MATGVLGLPVPRDGVDLLGIARGRRAAQNDNYEDIRRLQEQEQFAFERDARLESLRTRQWDRMAAAYTAPLLASQQRAADQGVGNVDWFLTQRQAIMADPNFTNLPPEAQQRVLQQLGASATAIAQQQIQAGDLGAAQRLYQALGADFASPLAQVAQSGNADLIIDTAIQQGAPYRRNADGTVTDTSTGITAPAANVAWLLAQSPNNLTNALPAFVNAQARAAAEAETLRQQQAAARDNRMRQILQLQLQGYQPSPDGFWRNPLQPNLPPIAVDPVVSVGEITVMEDPASAGAPVVAAGAAPAAVGAAAPAGAPVSTTAPAPVTPAQRLAASAGGAPLPGEPVFDPLGNVVAGGTIAPPAANGDAVLWDMLTRGGGQPTAVQQAIAQQATAYAQRAATPAGALQIKRQGSVARTSAIRTMEDRLRELNRLAATATPAQRATLQAEALGLSTAIANLRSN